MRKFFAFLHHHGILQTNPALSVPSARREEKEPARSYGLRSRRQADQLIGA
jgi:hypothetical protein